MVVHVLKDVDVQIKRFTIVAIIYLSKVKILKIQWNSVYIHEIVAAPG